MNQLMQILRPLNAHTSAMSLILASLVMPAMRERGLLAQDPPTDTARQTYVPVGNEFLYPVRDDFNVPLFPPYRERLGKALEAIREVLPQRIEADLAHLEANLKAFKQELGTGSPNATAELSAKLTALNLESARLRGVVSGGHATVRGTVYEIKSGIHERGGHTSDDLSPEMLKITQSAQRLMHDVLAMQKQAGDKKGSSLGGTPIPVEGPEFLTSEELTKKFGAPLDLLQKSFFRLTGKDLPPGVTVRMKRSPEALAALSGVRAAGLSEERAGLVHVVAGDYLLEYSVLAHEFGHLIVPASTIANKAGASKEVVEELEEAGAFLFQLALSAAVEDEQLRALLMRWNVSQSNQYIANHCTGSRDLHSKAMMWAIAIIEAYGIRDAIGKLATTHEFSPEIISAADNLRRAYWQVRLESEGLLNAVEESQYSVLTERANNLMRAIQALSLQR